MELKQVFIYRYYKDIKKINKKKKKHHTAINCNILYSNFLFLKLRHHPVL